MLCFWLLQMFSIRVCRLLLSCGSVMVCTVGALFFCPALPSNYMFFVVRKQSVFESLLVVAPLLGVVFVVWGCFYLVPIFFLVNILLF